jgi:UDP-N-acetyl-2-amino-2-deoxyglucuronate dehydrogenase
VVLNPWNCDALMELEKEFGRKVYTILQLRLHPKIIELKQRIDAENSGRMHDVDLTYITSRGKWYQYSWKGIREKSGGLATNIGVHFFDLLLWLFGPVVENKVYLDNLMKGSGFLQLERARVKWFLSLDRQDLPENVNPQNPSTHRSIKIDGEEVEFSHGFRDLHTVSYEKILSGNGFGLSDARPSIQLCHDIRSANETAMDDPGQIHQKLLE